MGKESALVGRRDRGVFSAYRNQGVVVLRSSSSSESTELALIGPAWDPVDGSRDASTVWVTS